MTWIIVGAVLLIISHYIMFCTGFDMANYKGFNHVLFIVGLIIAIAAFSCIGKGFHDRSFDVSQRNLAKTQIVQENQ